MKVVNVREYGGLSIAKAAGVIYIGRPSPLGNPYSHMAKTSAKFFAETREIAIENYRKWLYLRITSSDERVIQALKSLNEDSVLGCWCKPLACHGDVIVSAWKWWSKQC